MRTRALRLASSIALALMLFSSLGLAASRKAAPAQKMNMSGMNMSGMKKMDAAGTVFCPGMSTGQLCPTGTVATLKLTGERKQNWSEAVSRYNQQAVGAATQQLLRSVKPTLTPQQYAQVQRWFSVGLNPQINLLLQENERSHR